MPNLGLAVAMLCSPAIRQKAAVPIKLRVFFPHATNRRNLYVCPLILQLKYVCYCARSTYHIVLYDNEVLTSAWIDDGYSFIHSYR